MAKGIASTCGWLSPRRACISEYCCSSFASSILCPLINDDSSTPGSAARPTPTGTQSPTTNPTLLHLDHVHVSYKESP